MNSLRNRIILILVSLAVIPLLVGGLMTWRIYDVQAEQALNLEREIAQRTRALASAFIQERSNELRLVTQVSGLQTDENQMLASLLSQSDVYTNLILFDAQGTVQAYQSRYLVTGESTPEDLVRSDSFQVPLETGEIYYSPVQIDPKTGETIMTIGLPLLDLRSGLPNQILIADFRLKTIWDQIASIKGKDTVYIVDDQGRVIVHENLSLVLSNTQFTVPEKDGTHEGLGGSNVILASDTFEVGQQQFTVVAEHPFSDAMRLARDTLILVAAVLLAAILITIFIGVRAANWIVRPIQNLAHTARAIRDGDLSRRAETNRTDEIGTLAEAFNDMTAQLQETLQGLEARVAERTRNLSSVATVAQRAATILDVPLLLQTVCDLTKEDFDLYHAHIYLLDKSGEYLNLSAGAGDVGRTMVGGGHRIALDHPNSLVALAARSQQVVVVGNVSASPSFLPNPLLPNTRSELAIALVSREQLLGVLDVQSDKPDHFGPELVTIVETLARQIAAALSNARLFTSIDQSARREQALGSISQQIQGALNVEEVLQVAARELGKVLHVPQTIVELRMK